MFACTDCNPSFDRHHMLTMHLILTMSKTSFFKYITTHHWNLTHHTARQVQLPKRYRVAHEQPPDLGLLHSQSLCAIKTNETGRLAIANKTHKTPQHHVGLHKAGRLAACGFPPPVAGHPFIVVLSLLVQKWQRGPCPFISLFSNDYMLDLAVWAAASWWRPGAAAPRPRACCQLMLTCCRVMFCTSSSFLCLTSVSSSLGFSKVCGCDSYALCAPLVVRFLFVASSFVVRFNVPPLPLTICAPDYYEATNPVIELCNLFSLSFFSLFFLSLFL